MHVSEEKKALIWLFDLCYACIILKIMKIRNEENEKLLDLEFKLKSMITVYAFMNFP